MMNDAFGDNAKDRKQVKRLARKLEARLEEAGSVFFDLPDAEVVFHYYLDEGELNRADKLLVATRAIYPRSAVVSQWSALLALENGQNADALEYAEDAIAAGPEDIRNQLLHAEVLTRNGSYKEARDILMGLIDQTDFPEEVLLQLGDIAQVQGDFETSEKYYREALTLSTSFPAAVYELAALLEVQGRELESIALYTEFLNNNPFATANWYEFGSLYARLERYTEALDAFEYALAIEEDFSEAYYRKALCLMALDRFQEALPVLLEVLNRKHMEPHVHYHTAVCYEQIKLYPDAGRHFHKAATADTHHADAWRGLARTFAQREQYIEATHAYGKAIELENDQAETYLDLAICEYKLGNAHAAGTRMQEALRIDSSNPAIWLNWASLLAADKRLASAIEFLEAGMSMQSGMPVLYYRCAAYLYAAGRDGASFQLLEQALVQDGGAEFDKCDVVPDMLEDPAVKRLVRRYKES